MPFNLIKWMQLRQTQRKCGSWSGREMMTEINSIKQASNKNDHSTSGWMKKEEKAVCVWLVTMASNQINRLFTLYLLSLFRASVTTAQEKEVSQNPLNKIKILN